MRWWAGSFEKTAGVSDNYVVHRSEATTEVLDACAGYLATDPVRHNLVLTLLRGRAGSGEPGRYWWVEGGGEVCGVAFQSPIWFTVTVTPMTAPIVEALVPVIAADAFDAPGVSGEAGTVAKIAGAWNEVTGRPAYPVEGQRLYRLGALTMPDVPGGLSRAEANDLDLVEVWADEFEAETGSKQATTDTRALLASRIDDELLWVWQHDDTPTTIAMLSIPVLGTVRVGLVYTPPESRRRGFAGALVAHLSQHALAMPDVDTCLLYTQISNPTSNRVYRAIGYEAIDEMLVYRFE